MKTLKKYILTAILCSALTATAFPQESDVDHLIIPLTDPSRAPTVNVEIFTGSIFVKGYGGNEVIVDMEYPENYAPPKTHHADTTGRDPSMAEDPRFSSEHSKAIFISVSCLSKNIPANLHH